MATTETTEIVLTKDEAYEANLKRAHKCLVEAKHCLFAAAQQTDALAASLEAERIAEALHGADDDELSLIERLFALRFISEGRSCPNCGAEARHISRNVLGPDRVEFLCDACDRYFV